MNVKICLSFVLSSATFLGGCAVQKEIRIELSEPWRLGFRPDSFGSLPASSPERCQNALIKGYKQGSDRGAVQAIRYANTLIEKWPYHSYLPGSVHLAGWAVLFADTRHRAAAVGSGVYSWESYIDSLLTASYYFEMSAGRDASSEGFWTSAAGSELSMIHEGFQNVDALHLYVEARRLSKIVYLRTQDENTLIRAVKRMEEIEDRHPEWARQYGVSFDKKETIGSIALQETRRKEAQRIFGD